MGACGAIWSAGCRVGRLLCRADAGACSAPTPTTVTASAQMPIRTGRVMRSNLPEGAERHSHSMVPGGFEVTSNATRLTPGTSLMRRLDIRSSTSYGKRAQSAVMASSLVTARMTMG